jgi:hypothetical protein
MWMGALMPPAPALSVALALNVSLPDAAFRQRNEYGALVSSPSFTVPSARKNSTFWTVPSASLADALMVMSECQANDAPSDGDVMLTAGG